MVNKIKSAPGEKEQTQDLKKLDRRRFLAAGGAIGIAAGLGLPGGTGAKTGIEFVKSSCGEGNKAAARILVAYGSKCGSTGQVADAIAKELCAAGAAADARLLREAAALTPYQAVIVGSAVHNFKWLPEAAIFVNKNKALLAKIPVAYF